MPIYEFGYRHWNGTLRPWWLRWFPITRTGFELAWQGRMLRRVLFLAWMPLLYFGAAFFALGKMTEPGTDGGPRSNSIVPSFAMPPGPHGRPPVPPDALETIGYGMLGLPIGPKLREDPRAVRAAAWSWSFYQYMRLPQLSMLFLVVTLVGPPLISQDVRSKSFLVYFSKPITRWDYLAGKAGVVLAFAFLVTLAPALVLYVISIGFSPSLGALVDTGWTVVRIFASFAVTVVPATLVVLFYSSLTREPRFATFAWVSTCILGELFYWVLQAIESWRGSPWVFLVSPRQIAQVAMAAIFDVRGQFEALSGNPLAAPATHDSETAALVALAAISAVCLVGIMRQVTAPLRV
ncbi:MAG TPA: hypothetical protein VGX78_00685 [Pirellulales bacterium]|nr:hypothetical protein [Pirellulales bacterium]